MYKKDCIAAVATAVGGGVAIIRISGEECFSILERIFRVGKNKKRTTIFDSHKAVYGFIVDETDENNVVCIDEVLVLPMKEPKTYTRESIVEIHAHGGVKTVQKIMELIIISGARLAEAGEFTKRAFLNGRIDLSQAEAVSDLINSKTEQGRKLAMNQLSGGLLNVIKELRQKSLLIIANIEANIDYPENDIEELSTNKIKMELEEIQSELNKLYKSSEQGKIIREGISTVILGTPNVGKSSLLNALLKEDRAIVTEIAGTTRDILQEYITIGNVPLKIIDTAGIRETKDYIEKIGVSLSKKYALIADLILVVLDGTKFITQESLELIKAYRTKNMIILINKIDISNEIDLSYITDLVDSSNIIKISAKKNVGLEILELKINQMFSVNNLEIQSNDLFINMRHKESIINALESLNHALETIDAGMSQEFISIDLSDLYNNLGEIIGESVSEDIIDKIFSEFCLGK